MPACRGILTRMNELCCCFVEGFGKFGRSDAKEDLLNSDSSSSVLLLKAWTTSGLSKRSLYFRISAITCCGGRCQRSIRILEVCIHIPGASQASIPSKHSLQKGSNPEHPVTSESKDKEKDHCTRKKCTSRVTLPRAA